MRPDRILFLDFDGVLNNHTWMLKQPITTNLLYRVDPDNVLHLADIVKATDCSIVISSTWRKFKSIEEIRKILIEAGLPSPSPVIGATPVLWRDNDGTRKFRGDEIQLWLDNYNEPVSAIAILDDDNDMVHLLPRLVNTDFDLGLQPEHVKKTIKLLTE